MRSTEPSQGSAAGSGPGRQAAAEADVGASSAPRRAREVRRGPTGPLVDGLPLARPRTIASVERPPLGSSGLEFPALGSSGLERPPLGSSGLGSPTLDFPGPGRATYGPATPGPAASPDRSTLLAVIEAVGVGVVVTDPAGNTIAANSRARSLLDRGQGRFAAGGRTASSASPLPRSPAPTGRRG